MASRHPEDGAQGHDLGDPQEALAYFTSERQAAARPRGIRLDEHGRRLPEESPRSDVAGGDVEGSDPTEGVAADTDDTDPVPHDRTP